MAISIKAKHVTCTSGGDTTILTASGSEQIVVKSITICNTSETGQSSSETGFNDGTSDMIIVEEISLNALGTASGMPEDSGGSAQQIHLDNLQSIFITAGANDLIVAISYIVIT